MIDFFRKLFESTDFMPHGHCYLWQADILGLTVVGDGLTGIAYFTLPLMLFYIVKKREDLAQRKVFILFAIFIMACGTTHFIDIWTIWFPTYRLAGFVTLLTGLISIVTSFALYKALPHILNLPSNSRLELAYAELTEQMVQKEKAQLALRKANEELESRVLQRSAQLIRSNRELEKEIETRKLAEKKLIQKNAELIRINGDLDNFVYCASHDLKSPIVNAQGLISALKEENTDSRPEVDELVNRLDKAVQHMHSTVQDLTEVSTLDKNIDKADFKNLVFTEVLDEVKTNLSKEIKESGVEITADFEAAPAVWFTHKNLNSIIYNLVSNGIKYRTKERVPQVKLTTYDLGNYTVLTVADNGIGIDLIKHEKKIFSLFKRLHDNIEGSGVGLFIVKRIMDNNQGKIEVESKLEVGTTLKVYFPKS